MGFDFRTVPRFRIRKVRYGNEVFFGENELFMPSGRERGERRFQEIIANEAKTESSWDVAIFFEEWELDKNGHEIVTVIHSFYKKGYTYVKEN